MSFLLKRQTKFLNRKIHRIGSIVIALPILIVIVSGLVLQLKKPFDWVQPPTQKGSSKNLSLTFDEILETAISVKEANISSWEDINRLDIRPSKGIIKIRANNRWETQIDSQTGEILQVSFRRSDLIESIHDGSYFSNFVKYGIFLPAAIILFLLWVTGLYMFILPHIAKRLKSTN